MCLYVTINIYRLKLRSFLAAKYMLLYTFWCEYSRYMRCTWNHWKHRFGCFLVNAFTTPCDRFNLRNVKKVAVEVNDAKKHNEKIEYSKGVIMFMTVVRNPAKILRLEDSTPRLSAKMLLTRCKPYTVLNIWCNTHILVWSCTQYR